MGRQVAHDAIDHRRIVVEDNLCPAESSLTRTRAAFVERFGTYLAHGINVLLAQLSLRAEKNSKFSLNIGMSLDESLSGGVPTRGRGGFSRFRQQEALRRDFQPVLLRGVIET